MLACNQKTLSQILSQHLSSSEKLINLYTQEKPQFYKIINQILFSLNESAILSFSPIITTLRSSIFSFNDQKTSKNEKFPKLYRGINRDVNEFLKSNKINDLIVFHGFTSTTTNLLTALKFAKKKILLEIQYQYSIFSDLNEDHDSLEYRLKKIRQSLSENMQENKNQNKMRAKDISSISKFSKEAEYLFPCFSAFKIIDHAKKYDCEYITIEFVCIIDDQQIIKSLEYNTDSLFEFNQKKEKEQQRKKEEESYQNQFNGFIFQSHNDDGGGDGGVMQIQQIQPSQKIQQNESDYFNKQLMALNY